MRTILAVCAFLLFQGCSILNPNADSDNYYRRYAGDIHLSVIDKAIESEVRKEVPSGIHGTLYSPEDWNTYWNRRINFLFDIGHNEVDREYRGPSGPELIKRIVETRRKRGLPELVIEERNRNKVP